MFASSASLPAVVDAASAFSAAARVFRTLSWPWSESAVRLSTQHLTLRCLRRPLRLLHPAWKVRASAVSFVVMSCCTLAVCVSRSASASLASRCSMQASSSALDAMAICFACSVILRASAAAADFVARLQLPRSQPSPPAPAWWLQRPTRSLLALLQAYPPSSLKQQRRLTLHARASLPLSPSHRVPHWPLSLRRRLQFEQQLRLAHPWLLLLLLAGRATGPP